MFEVELKFQVPEAEVARLRRAVATRRANAAELQAFYFDTPDRALAKARLALRLRREDDRWVQAVKGPGDGVLQRLEHEVPRGATRLAPALDLSLHDAEPAIARALADALGGREGALDVVFESDVRRTRRLVRHGGAAVEIAFDEGVLRAGGRELKVCEVEFELKSGPPTALVELAAAWAGRHHLWLDPRTKAERGERLAQGVETGPPVKARTVALPAGTAPDEALRGMARECLRQILANAAELADGRGRPEHVHQLRVGLRRLRSALRSFDRWCRDPQAARALEAQARPLFSALGARRDRDVVAEMLAGPLHAAGHAVPAFSADDREHPPEEVVRDAAFRVFTLHVLAFGLHGEAAAAAPPAAKRLKPTARKALDRLWQRIAADADRFVDIEEEERHALRKRAKRLRYALEFTAPLFPARRVAKFLAALEQAQDAIGAYNDAVVAQDLLRRLDPTAGPNAFAAGWIAARRDETLRACARPLRRLRRARLPWVRPGRANA